MLFDFLSKKTGIPLFEEQVPLSWKNISCVYFNSETEQLQLVEYLNKKDFKKLKGSFKRTEQEQEAGAIELHSKVYTHVYLSRKFKSFIRRELDAKSSESVVIAKQTKSFRRYFDNYEYDIQTEIHYLVLLPNGSYVGIFRGHRYSPNLLRD